MKIKQCCLHFNTVIMSLYSVGAIQPFQTTVGSTTPSSSQSGDIREAVIPKPFTPVVDLTHLESDVESKTSSAPDSVPATTPPTLDQWKKDLQRLTGNPKLDPEVVWRKTKRQKKYRTIFQQLSQGSQIQKQVDAMVKLGLENAYSYFSLLSSRVGRMASTGDSDAKLEQQDDMGLFTNAHMWPKQLYAALWKSKTSDGSPALETRVLGQVRDGLSCLIKVYDNPTDNPELRPAHAFCTIFGLGSMAESQDDEKDGPLATTDDSFRQWLSSYMFTRPLCLYPTRASCDEDNKIDEADAEDLNAAPWHMPPSEGVYRPPSECGILVIEPDDTLDYTSESKTESAEDELEELLDEFDTTSNETVAEGYKKLLAFLRTQEKKADGLHQMDIDLRVRISAYMEGVQGASSIMRAQYAQLIGTNPNLFVVSPSLGTFSLVEDWFANYIRCPEVLELTKNYYYLGADDINPDVIGLHHSVNGSFLAMYLVCTMTHLSKKLKHVLTHSEYLLSEGVMPEPILCPRVLSILADFGRLVLFLIEARVNRKRDIDVSGYMKVTKEHIKNCLRTFMPDWVSITSY